MTDITQSKSAQIWITPPKNDPVAVSKRHIVNNWPLMTLTLGVITTFAWIMFLGWCALFLAF